MTDSNLYICSQHQELCDQIYLGLYFSRGEWWEIYSNMSMNDHYDILIDKHQGRIPEFQTIQNYESFVREFGIPLTDFKYISYFSPGNEFYAFTIVINDENRCQLTPIALLFFNLRDLSGYLLSKMKYYDCACQLPNQVLKSKWFGIHSPTETKDNPNEPQWGGEQQQKYADTQMGIIDQSIGKNVQEMLHNNQKKYAALIRIQQWWREIQTRKP